jgi:hypothetical protein
MGACPVVVSVILSPEFLEVGETRKKGVAEAVGGRSAFETTEGVDYAGYYGGEMSRRVISEGRRRYRRRRRR